MKPTNRVKRIEGVLSPVITPLGASSAESQRPSSGIGVPG